MQAIPNSGSPNHSHRPTVCLDSVVTAGAESYVAIGPAAGRSLLGLSSGGVSTVVAWMAPGTAVYDLGISHLESKADANVVAGDRAA